MNKDAVAEISQKYQVETAQNLVPEGYKQTEVGVIPEDWEVVTISENHQVETGSTPPPSDKNNYGDSYFFVSPADLGDEKVILRTEKMLSKKGFSLSRKFPAGSTLFTCIGSTIGKTGYAPLELTSNQQINAVFPNEENDSDFTYYALTYLAPRVKALAGEQAVPLVNKTSFGETKYPLPPTRKEQEAIGEVLSDTDALLSELEKLIAKKQAIKTATMQQLLTGHTRLPQFAHHPDGSKKGYKQSELGEIPEDWEVLTFSSLAKPSSARVNPKLYGGGDFCIELEHISQGGGYLTGSTQTSSTSSLKSVFEKGDVLFGKLRAYLKKYWLARKSGVCSTEIWVLKAEQQKSISSFLFFVVQTDRFIEEASEAYGTHMPRSDWNVMSQLPIATPSIEEQTAIATILSDMDAEIQALEHRLNKTRQIKQGMMQELLTGKTRLIKGGKNV